MRKAIVISKEERVCPICGKLHFIEERCRRAETVIKGQSVCYDQKYYFCSNASEDENEYESGAMLNINLLNALNAYRKQNNLLTSDEIVSIRKDYSLSQVDLARLLGWGEATISRYESKAIQDEAYDNTLRQLKDSPYIVFEYFKRNQSSFSLDKQSEIKNKIDEKMDSYGREVTARQALMSEYVQFDTPSDLNGNRSLDIDKIEAIVSYYAKKIKDLYKVKLMKMLWYADAISYMKSGSSMTGLVYLHKEMGALPVGHNKLLSLERINVQEETSANYDLLIHFYPLETIDYSVLMDDEIEILDTVIRKFKRYQTKQIIEYMHKEKAYSMTEADEIIPYSLARDLREFKSGS